MIARTLDNKRLSYDGMVYVEAGEHDKLVDLVRKWSEARENMICANAGHYIGVISDEGLQAEQVKYQRAGNALEDAIKPADKKPTSD